MKIKSLVKSLFLATTLSSTLAFADDIQLGHPGYGGSGCPAGSASVTLSPDNKSLSLIFDEYMVEAGGDTRKRMKRKTCNIAIPVHVPQGLSVSIIDIDYRGYNSIPRGGMARFSAEYFFAGQRGPRFLKNFRGPMDDEFLISNKLGVFANIWSACGEDVNLRVNSSMLVKTNRKKEEVLSMVDSADVSAGIVYHLKWKRCNLVENHEDDLFDDDWF